MGRLEGLVSAERDGYFAQPDWCSQANPWRAAFCDSLKIARNAVSGF
jgi:hypothetical protein